MEHPLEFSAELAPCGVFCGACPSFNQTCFGCASEDKTQKRTSKWACKIRNCCYNTKKQHFCIDCDQFPCQLIRKKLIDSHPEDWKFQYRHDIQNNFEMMKNLGMKDYLEYQQIKWSCPICRGRIHFYHYQCSQCGKKIRI